MKLWASYAYHRTRDGVSGVAVFGTHDEALARPEAEALVRARGETLRPGPGEPGRWAGRPDGMPYVIFETGEAGAPADDGAGSPLPS